MNNIKTNCIFTILSSVDVLAYRLQLESGIAHDSKYEHIIIVIDVPIDESDLLPKVSGWQVNSANGYITENFLDKAFIFNRDEFTNVCLIYVLDELKEQYEAIVFCPPHKLESLNIISDKEFDENTIYVFSNSPLQAIDSLLETSNNSDDIIVFSNGAELSEYIIWCKNKIDFVLRIYNGFLLPKTLCSSQFDFIHMPLAYAMLFNITIKKCCLDNQIFNLEHKNNTQLIESSNYRFAELEDGTTISPLLRDNYLRDYRLRERCQNNPFSSTDVLLGESCIIADTYPVPLTPIMREILSVRSDIKSAFHDLESQNDRFGYTEWFLELKNVDSTLKALDDSYFFGVKRLFNLNISQLQIGADSSTAGQRVINKVSRAFLKGDKKAHSLTKQGNLDENLPKGINLCGYIKGAFGLGEALRILAEILETAKIPFTIVDFESGGHYFTETQWDHKITNKFLYNTNIIGVGTDNHAAFMKEIDPSVFTTRYNIGYWFWELQDFPDSRLPCFGLVDEVWTASKFLRDVFANFTSDPVITIPLSISMTDLADFDRSHFGIEEDAFVFFMTYDPGSISERKNPDAAITAFINAFGDNNKTQLIIKCSKRMNGSKEDKILSRVEKSSNINLVEGVFPKSEMNALIRCCDVLVSLHRAEGFGLAPAEAMYLGKPTILTNWSGNTEYMTSDNCCPVDYKLVELEVDYLPYEKGFFWAEPDIDQASAYMRRLFEDKEYYDSIAVEAQKTMETQFSSEAIAKILRNRLEELELI